MARSFAAPAGVAAWSCPLLLAAGCAGSAPASASSDPERFPPPNRPVAPVVSASWDSEAERDRRGEADRVFDHLRLAPGMRVADIGAGSGYYTVRLARRLGPTATIYAVDIEPSYLADLEARLSRERLPTVRTVLGTADDPRLPPSSVDVALLGHMYHEIENPYTLLNSLLPALAPGAKVAIVDVDRPTTLHGTPPGLLRCELAALGFRELEYWSLSPAEGYLMIFDPPYERPSPDRFTPCDSR